MRELTTGSHRPRNAAGSEHAQHSQWVVGAHEETVHATRVVDVVHETRNQEGEHTPSVDIRSAMAPDDYAALLHLSHEVRVRTRVRITIRATCRAAQLRLRYESKRSRDEQRGNREASAASGRGQGKGTNGCASAGEVRTIRTRGRGGAPPPPSRWRGTLRLKVWERSRQPCERVRGA